MRHARVVVVGMFVVALAVLVGRAGQATSEFDLDWHTIDAGGVLHSTAMGYELSGTIGQHDVGKMTGQRYELNGGFWFEIPLGDCQDNGTVDLYDMSLFEGCLQGPDAGPPGTACMCFDVNRDTHVDVADYAVIQKTFTGP